MQPVVDIYIYIYKYIYREREREREREGERERENNMHTPIHLYREISPLLHDINKYMHIYIYIYIYICTLLEKYVEVAGIDPAASSMLRTRSTT